MSAWAITQSTRFKAAVPRAGIYDWRAFHGKTYLNGWEVVHYGGREPWDVLDVWEKFSPINYVRNVETPTLIVHGELDLTCPVEGAYAFYRALKELGVETELIVYPRAGHGINERKHKLDQKNRSAKWILDRLLG
jgi:dipeptidyl aminopeptidase/acylaminoacyl peptidase